MKQYLDLCRFVLENGERRQDRDRNDLKIRLSDESRSE